MPRDPGLARLARLAAVLLPLAACADRGPDLGPARPLVYGGDPDAAPALIRAFGCGSCHVVPGVRGANGTVGPPLTGFAERAYIAGNLANTPENLVAWIVDPQAVEPGTAMPVTGIDAAQARHVAAYLYTLR